MGTLTGKVALVTGAGRGIGAAIAERFLEEDAAGVVILEFSEERVKNAQSAYGNNQSKVLALRCDVSDDAQVKAAVQKAVERFGTIDILVNNAGIIRDKIFHHMTDEQWYGVINTNLNGIYIVTKHVLPLMRTKGGGSIINMSSIAHEGNVGQCNYSAAKAGVIAFTKSLALESGRKNIRVNAIAPGFIKTDILDEMPQDILEEKVKTTPFGRLGSPRELANVVVFLASDAASFVSGECITVSGAGRI